MSEWSEAEADRPEAHEGVVFLMGDVGGAGVFVTPEVEGADDDGTGLEVASTTALVGLKWFSPSGNVDPRRMNKRFRAFRD